MNDYDFGWVKKVYTKKVDPVPSGWCFKTMAAELELDRAKWAHPKFPESNNSIVTEAGWREVGRFRAERW